MLDEARVSGHLFLSVDETVGQCYELLNMGCDDEVVSEEEIRQAISNERVESRIYVEGSRVYLSYERMCEVKSAKRIVSMILQEGFTKIDDLDSKIDNAERTLHQRLAPSQRNAVKLCLSHPISIMTGGPGSGKTTHYDSYWISIKLRSLRMKSSWLHLLAVPVGAWQNRRECTPLHFTQRLAL